jgi:cytoskeletal protein CcmA (bactofilin family)
MFKKLFERKPKRRTTDQLDEPTTRIAPGFLFEGQLEGKGVYLIEGEVVGEGRIRGIVTLAAGSYWKGNLTADVVLLAGKFEGNLTAEEKIDLAPTAQITGDLTAPSVSIAEGAVVEGRISRPRKTQVTRYSERRGQGEPPDSASA